MALRCHICNSGFSLVTHTYPEIHYAIRGKAFTKLPRRRQCKHCGNSWITYETVCDEEKDLGGIKDND